MRLASLFLATLIFLAPVANAQTAAQTRFTVKTAAGEITVDGFAGGADSAHPALLILSGSKGFGAPAYEEIGRTFHAAGLDVYLVHILSPADVNAIAAAGSARARISYYATRFASWTTAVQGVVSDFRQRHRAGGIGVLGISLGAEIAATVSAASEGIDALVLVDGGFPEGASPPARPLPPLQLIWGADDQVFAVSTAQALSQKVRALGGSAGLNVYKGGQHDFFLKSKAPEAHAAYDQVVAFLMSKLSPNP